MAELGVGSDALGRLRPSAGVTAFGIRRGRPGTPLPAYETTPDGTRVFRRGVDDSPVLGWLDKDTVLIADGGVVA